MTSSLCKKTLRYCTPSQPLPAYICILVNLTPLVNLLFPNKELKCRFKIAVDIGSHQNDIHSGIKPEHQDNDRCQASVGIKSIKFIDIYRKAKCCRTPSDCRKPGSRKLHPKSLLCSRHIRIHQCDNERHDHPHKGSPEMHQQCKKVRAARNDPLNDPDQGISKYHNQKRNHHCHQRQDRI